MDSGIIKVLRFGIVTGIVMTVCVLIASWWFSFIKADEAGPVPITNASNAIIQLDSFLAAGFIVGFFFLGKTRITLRKTEA